MSARLMFSYFYIGFIILILRGFSIGPSRAVGFIVFEEQRLKHLPSRLIEIGKEIKSSNYVSSVLQDLYHQMTLKETCTDDVIHIIIAKGLKKLDEKKELIQFSTNINNLNNKIMKSELHLVFSGPTELSSVRLTHGANKNTKHFIINKLPRSNISDKDENNKEIYDVTEIVKNVTNVNLEFLRKTESNSLEESGTLQHAFILSLGKSSKSPCNATNNPVMSSSSRRRRSIPSSRTGCRRKSKFVNFRDIGWDKWIIFPEGYEKYTCKGGCQFPAMVNYKTSNEALVQALLHTINRKNAPAYCAPSKLSNLKMIYLDSANENVITVASYPELVVESCGCV